MTEGNILGTDQKIVTIVFMLKTNQRKTKFFEFSKDAIREELQITKNDVTL